MPDSPGSERFAEFRLWMADGVGRERRDALLERFGTAEAVFAASGPQLTSVAGIGPKLAGSILDVDGAAAAKADWDRMAGLGIQWLHCTDAEFPAMLLETPRCPIAVTVLGSLVPVDAMAVAIVGSRRCSPYGVEVASRLAYDLASRGVTIVSGLARGVDAAAHRAALDAGGRTIAVLASGLANIYPPEHSDLAEAVAANGAVISEAPLDGPPIGNLFPLRNRIISGLSRGVVVVEAAARSGALSTAYHALDQNREVFAVPGRIGDLNSAGSNELLRKGATLVRGFEDIVEHLGPIDVALPAPREKPENARSFQSAQIAAAAPAGPPPNLTEVERRIWDALAGPLDLDTLGERTGLSTRELSGNLLMLEMRRVVVRQPGNRFART